MKRVTLGCNKKMKELAKIALIQYGNTLKFTE